MKRGSLVVVTVSLLLGSMLLACSGAAPVEQPASTPGPRITETARPAPSAPRGAPADGPTGPGPRPGPCPIDQSICKAAQDLLAVLRAGTVDAFMALAEPIPAVCTDAVGFGGPSRSLCLGAASGETRRGYWDIQGGEGLIVPESDFRRTLQRWFAAIQNASGNDAYGPGDLRIGSVACGRLPAEPANSCTKGMIRVHFTFIVSPSANVADGVGLPGQRTTFHVSLHESAKGQLEADGFGQSVPPNANLLSFYIDARTPAGEQVIWQIYPWTP